MEHMGWDAKKMLRPVILLQPKDPAMPPEVIEYHLIKEPANIQHAALIFSGDQGYVHIFKGFVLSGVYIIIHLHKQNCPR